MSFLDISPYVFGTSLSWYSVFVLLGALTTYIISEYFYKKDPESKKCPDLILNTFLIAFPAGLIGARIWFILSEWEYYSNYPIEMLKVWEGGLAIQGGVMLGAAVGIYFAIHQLRKHGMSLKITTLTDMIIPNILIAQVIGRWGNFFNQEVYGAITDPTPYKWIGEWFLDQMTITDFSYEFGIRTGFRTPLFLIEGIFNFVGFILITIVLRKWYKKRPSGVLTSLYLVWYGTVRACLEGLREEEFIMRWGNVSQSLVTSIAFVMVGFGLLAYFYVKDYKDKQLIKVNNDIDILENDQNFKVEIEEEKSIDLVVKEETKKEPVKKVSSKTNITKKTVSKNEGSKKSTIKNSSTKKVPSATRKTTTKKVVKEDKTNE